MAESRGLMVIGTVLVLEGAIVGAAVAGYALAGFSQVAAIQRWAKSTAVPFDRLWNIVRGQSPIPERRLKLHGELLQVLGDALLRENYRTRQYEDAVVQLRAAAATKDEFLAVLSHELRTPLAPIAGWANVLKQSTSMKYVHQAAEAIERNALLQSRMVDDLLDTTRIAQGTVSLDFSRQDLSGLIRSAVETSVQEIEKKSIRLEVSGIDEPLFVDADAGRMQQVFRNILSNAAKFTPAGGSIRLTLSREEDSARVAVADTGVGIAPEFLPFMFDMFRQEEQGTRRQHGGLGIGLAVVKRLVELHKGTVSAASAGAGRGAEIVVRLPIVVETRAHDHALPVNPEASAPGLAGLSVLVVEDEDDARESLRALLELLGAQVSVAHDGREALAMMHDAQPDLVLCDLRMPRMDGFEFVRELHRGPSEEHPPVVAVSGLASDADRQRTRDAGFEGHIAKPFDAGALLVAVDAAFSHRAQH